MRRKLFCALLACLMFHAVAFAGTADAGLDLSGFTVDELLELRELIQAELLLKGYNPYFDLERGDSGEQVAAVQEKLQELGYYTGGATGKLDAETQKAFKRFEKDFGLNNDGLPSREDQFVLFQAKALEKPATSPTPQVTEDPMTAVYQEYEPFDYTASMRKPEEYDGRKVVLKGRVLQVLGNREEGFQICLATSGSGDVVYVFINQPLDYNLIEDDYLTIYAVMHKTITYQSTYNKPVTIPAAVADYFILR